MWISMSAVLPTGASGACHPSEGPGGMLGSAQRLGDPCQALDLTRPPGHQSSCAHVQNCTESLV